MQKASRAITLLLVAAVIAGVVFLIQPDTREEGNASEEKTAAADARGE